VIPTFVRWSFGMDLLLRLCFEICLLAVNDFQLFAVLAQLRQVLLYPWQIFAGTNLL